MSVLNSVFRFLHLLSSGIEIEVDEMFPKVKLVTLMIKQIVRPVANSLTESAKRNHQFRSYMVRIGKSKTYMIAINAVFQQLFFIFYLL